jgi:peptide/nickel transport system ATP-binding protein
MDTAPPVLRVRNLTVDFATDDGVVRAVDDVSFEVADDEMVALVGESGLWQDRDGLSLLRLVPEPPGRYAAGTVEIAGRDLLALPKDQVAAVRGRDVAMIFQEPMTALNPVFTIGSQITDVLRHHRDLSRQAARREAAAMLAAVNIPDPERRLDDYPHQLSGGMRQRVMIAMALSCRPRLLVADEPTTALDVTTQAQVLGEMSRLQREFRTAVILVTHDLGVVAETCARAIVMYCGSIVEAGPTAELFRRPSPSLHPRAARVGAPDPGRAPAGAAGDPGSRARPGQPAGGLPVRRPLQPRPGALPAGAPPAPAGGTRLHGHCRVLQPMVATVPGPAAAPPPLLDVRKLCTYFPVRGGLLRRVVAQVRAVDDVSFTLARGTTLGLVGESGCGKSTLGRTVLRLRTPTSGPGALRRQRSRWLSQRQLKPWRRRMQLVFQDPYASLSPRRTVAQTIREPLDLHRIGTKASRSDRVVELLEVVGLSSRVLDRYPHEFSGGQRQRVGIARALALDPRAHRCRRASVGPRRFGAVPGAEPGAPRAGGAGYRLPVHIPRPGRGPARQRPRGRHVPGPAGGARAGAARLLSAAPPLHPGAAGRGAPAGRRRDGRSCR